MPGQHADSRPRHGAGKQESRTASRPSSPTMAHSSPGLLTAGKKEHNGCQQRTRLTTQEQRVLVASTTFSRSSRYSEATIRRACISACKTRSRQTTGNSLSTQSEGWQHAAHFGCHAHHARKRHAVNAASAPHLSESDREDGHALRNARHVHVNEVVGERRDARVAGGPHRSVRHAPRRNVRAVNGDGCARTKARPMEAASKQEP